MKSVGERIRQARAARKMSGEDLAARVGYKNQSAIGNLENRAGSNGGSRIAAIADALCVPVAWLLQGPDSDEVPYSLPKSGSTTSASEGAANQQKNVLANPLLAEAVHLLEKMSPVGQEQAILYLRFMATQHSSGGERDSVPHQKAA